MENSTLENLEKGLAGVIGGTLSYYLLRSLNTRIAKLSLAYSLTQSKGDNLGRTFEFGNQESDSIKIEKIDRNTSEGILKSNGIATHKCRQILKVD